MGARWQTAGSQTEEEPWPSVRWYSVVVDSRDPRALSAWWAQVLGWRTAHEAGDEVTILPPHMVEDGFAERVPARERGQ